MLAHIKHEQQFAPARQLATRGWNLDGIGLMVKSWELGLCYMANCYIQSQINNFRPGLEIRGLSSSQLLNNAWLVDMDVDATKPPVCAMLNAKMQKFICRMRNI